MVRHPAPVQVRCVDGDPVEFQRRPDRREGHYLVTEILQQWIEESRWPFRTRMPVGGDRCRCFRVLARRSDEPHLPPDEFVLRMRAGPGVWDLRRLSA